ncbi:MAG: cbb3-type cytochrome c oxidase N-terminal domain-containing protein [Planctomycetota bacterium]
MTDTHTSSHGVPLREHEFDGIQEFDNKLPNWWLWTFYIAIIFSIGYWLWAHGLGLAPTDNEVMQRDLQTIREQAAGVDISEDGLQTDSLDLEIVANGRLVFEQNCITCHGPQASGIQADGSSGAGPNLTDAFWLNGGSAMQIHSTIFNGVEGKAMVAWNNLGSVAVRDVAAYVISLRNTNVEGKAAEGQEYTGQ